MNGYCLVVKAKDEIYSVTLIPDVANTHPVDVIKDYCQKYAVLPWPLDEWDEHGEEIEWFIIRDGERLEKIKWPWPRNDKEGQDILAFQIQVYRVFEIPQVNYKQALEALDNLTITRALGLGWSPQGLGSALGLLANAMEETDQAAAYRYRIMDMIEDVPAAVKATESIYEYAADEFLEEDMMEKLKSGPKAPKDMTDEELINEATQLHNVIFATDHFGVDGLSRLQTLEAQLFSRDYEVRAGAYYSVQKREEE